MYNYCEYRIVRKSLELTSSHVKIDSNSRNIFISRVATKVVFVFVLYFLLEMVILCLQSFGSLQRCGSLQRKNDNKKFSHIIIINYLIV